MSALAPSTAPPPAHPPAAAAAATARPRKMIWPELDVLRGLAGLAMVVNHTAVALVPAAAGALIALPDRPLTMTPVQWASFLGSFAPMLFFFITGVGYGLQARPGGVGRKPGLWSKAAVLFLADAMLWRVGGMWIGLDFFGFIALSMLLLGALNRLDRRWALAATAGLLVAVSILRYTAVPVAEKLLGPDAATPIAILTGHRSVTGISFPPMPWLGYPLVGFWVGAATTAFAARVDRHRLAVAAGLLVAAAVCVAATGFFIELGHPLHRWGRLAPSSYAAGFGVTAALLAACLAAFHRRGAESADRGPREPFSLTVRGLSLRGVAAFAVVPLHFLVLGFAEGFGITATTATGVLVGCVLVAILALGAAPWVSTAAERIRAGHHAAAAWWAGLAFALLALGLLCVPGWAGAARGIVASLGQLALCLLLALPLPWQNRPRSAGAAPAAVR